MRKCDSHKVQRYGCKACGRRFSGATGTLEFRQHKRRENPMVRKLLGAAVSMNEVGRILRITYKTVARKLVYWSKKCEAENEEILRAYHKVDAVQFDELETLEHTKCKPVSIALAVENRTRVILGFKVSRMPAKGPLAAIAKKKYGERVNERIQGLQSLMKSITTKLADNVSLLSDKCPLYAGIVHRTLQKEARLKVTFRQVKGRRGCVTAQGELKEGRYDSLFSLNHTCAMFRAHVSRLIRRTWNTTKKLENLVHHLNIYMHIHNGRALHLEHA